jgi:Cu2+-exporting ATPase
MSAADALEAELPRTVAVLRGNAWVRVAAETLAVGDRIRLEAGDVVPRAGVLVRSGSVDLAVVTGEARTQRLPKGAPVPAGARTLDGGLELIVQPARAKSLAPSASPRLRAVPMLADRLGSGFTITVTLLAIAGLWGWAVTVDLARGVEVATAILIVACPCAIGLAGPVVSALATRTLLQHRVLVRAPSVFERLGRAGTVVFDKTGTLTRGRPSVIGERVDGSPDQQRRLANALVAVEGALSHPIARAIVEHLEGSRRPVDSSEAATPKTGEAPRVRSLPGEGVVGIADDYCILALSRAAAIRSGIQTSAAAPSDGAASVIALGRPVRPGDFAAFDREDCVSWLGPEAATARLELDLRDEAIADTDRVVCELGERHGVEVTMLSGDSEDAVRRVAQRLRIDTFEGACSPERKLDEVRRLQSSAPVVMVGDGLNDVMALHGASLAIAPAHSTTGAVRASEVVLGATGLGGLLDLFDTARRARSATRGNLAIGLAYNLSAVSLALAGWITPLLAAVLMPLSSLGVIAHSLLRMRSADTRAPAREITHPDSTAHAP